VFDDARRLTDAQMQAAGRRGGASRLGLHVASDGAIRVSGEVIELGHGTLRLRESPPTTPAITQT
jgi:hypothetical protein